MLDRFAQNLARSIADSRVEVCVKSMIDCYTIKVAPAIGPKEIVKTLESTKEYNPEQLVKLQHLRIKIKVVSEAPDLKKRSDLLKQLSSK